MDKSLALLVPAFALCVTAAPGGEVGRHFTFAVPDYTSAQKDEAELDRQTEGVVTTHRALVAELTRQLRSRTLSNASRVYIVYLLGQLRPADPGAITALIENINLVAERVVKVRHIARWGGHPAQEALVRIGRRASGMILNIIGSAKFDAAKVNGYAYVLVDVEQPKYAHMKLCDRLAEAKDAEVRKQYQMVMARVQEVYIRPRQ